MTRCPVNTTCNALLDLVHEKTEIPRAVLMLSAYGRILDPSRTIKDQGLHNGQCIDVLIKGLGGGRSGEGTGESLHTHACQLLLSPGDSSMYYYNSHINLIMFDVSLAFPQPPIACCIRSTAAQLCLCQ